jgi:hypothetical protein
MTPHMPQRLSRRHFLTAAATGVFATAAVSISCTSRGCVPGRARASNPQSTFGYVDRSGWILTMDDARKLGPLKPAETR